MSTFDVQVVSSTWVVNLDKGQPTPRAILSHYWSAVRKGHQDVSGILAQNSHLLLWRQKHGRDNVSLHVFFIQRDARSVALHSEEIQLHNKGPCTWYGWVGNWRDRNVSLEWAWKAYISTCTSKKEIPLLHNLKTQVILWFCAKRMSIERPLMTQINTLSKIPWWAFPNSYEDRGPNDLF